MRKNIFYALLALAISFGLWLYVMTTEDPEWEDTYYNIPVILENESVLRDRGLMVTTEKDPTVTLKLSGSRSNLGKLNSSNITLIADLSRIYNAGEQSLSYDIIFPGDIPPNSITILSQSPQQITLSIAEWETKEIPVVPVYSGSVPEGFMTDRENRFLSHETITVTGPASVIRQITQAKINVDLTGKTETIVEHYQITLCDENGEAVDASQVDTNGITEIKLTLKIQRYKEVELRFEIVPGGGATAENSQIDFDVTKITVSGSEQLLEGLEYLDFGSINLAEYTADTSITYSIQDKLPEGVTNLSGKDKVTVTIRFPNLKMKTLQVTRIVPINVPDKMIVTVLTQELTVTVRGTQAQIDALSADDLTVIVDFTGAEQGTDTYKTTVEVANEFDAVGAVEFNNVSAVVSAEPGEA